MVLLKTSENDPFRIAELSLGKGLIGMSICPGSHDYEGRSGPRERSLEADLRVICEGGYGIVVTLLESWELEFLHVAHMQETVAAHDMIWWHVPVKDCCALEFPDDGFTENGTDRWTVPCTLLRSFLHAGGCVFIHCRGGLGRTGTLAAFLLIQDGLDAEDAMQRVRNVRPGAIEYQCQEDWLRQPDLRCVDPLSAGIPQSVFTRHGELLRELPRPCNLLQGWLLHVSRQFAKQTSRKGKSGRRQRPLPRRKSLFQLRLTAILRNLPA